MHLHFTQSLEPLQGAGLGSSALGLHQGFLEKGLDSRFYATRAADFHESWQAVEQYVRKGPQKAFYAPEMHAAASKHLPQADVIHGHGFYVYPNFLFGRFARANNKPLVYHIQGFLDPWILARSKIKKRVAHLLFENANFRQVAWWRAVSQKEYGQAKAYGLTAPVEVFPNGVHMPEARSDVEIASLIQRYPRIKEKRLVFLSRLHPKKGLDLLFNAWAQLDPKLTRDWEIAVFGPDEGSHQAEIATLIQDLGISDAVTFYGSVSGSDKEAAYRSADLFVLPSRSEGFPMAVLEASSYGLPVVQTNECNFPELTKANGAWEARPAVESIRKALEQALHADDSERQERGAAGRALVQRDYQWSAIARKVDQACKRHC